MATESPEPIERWTAKRRVAWAHLAAVIDCHDRETAERKLVADDLAKEAERAVEAACLHRFGTLRPMQAPVLRSDNGLIFQSRQFRQACRDYRLQQEFIPFCSGVYGWVQWYTRAGHTVLSAIEVRSNTGHNNQLGWLDFRGALQKINAARGLAQ